MLQRSLDEAHSQGVDFDIVSVTNAAGEVSYQVQAGPVSIAITATRFS